MLIIRIEPACVKLVPMLICMFFIDFRSRRLEASCMPPEAAGDLLVR